MILVWLTAGLLASSAETPISGGGWGEWRPPRRRKIEQDDEIERRIAEEAEQIAQNALAELEAQDRKRYLERLDSIVSMQPLPVEIDSTIIAEIAKKAVQALLTELEAEFDRFIVSLEIERDEEEAVIALMLAM